MKKYISESEIALSEIYQALDSLKDTVNKKQLEEKSRQYNKSGITSSPSRLFKRVVQLAPNFGVQVK